jgi:hypothetical protein
MVTYVTGSIRPFIFLSLLLLDLVAGPLFRPRAGLPRRVDEPTRGGHMTTNCSRHRNELHELVGDGPNCLDQLRSLCRPGFHRPDDVSLWLPNGRSGDAPSVAEALSHLWFQGSEAV